MTRVLTQSESDGGNVIRVLLVKRGHCQSKLD